VTLLTGTDAGNLGVIQGFSVHREIEKLVDAGLDAWQALAAATTNASALLGRRYGLTAGCEANLVILDASPIDDVRNTQAIRLVIHHGKRIDREALRPLTW
jgi:imidazolonepropionase-like amidohydrolase